MRAARTFIMLLAIAICLPLSKAQAGIMRHDVPEQDYLDFAADSMFQSAGAVWANWDDGWHQATGVLIHPEWVLTAGHPLLGNDDLGGGISEVRFYTGADSYQWEHKVFADQWFAYDGYTAARPSGTGVDLGLIHLVDPIFDIVPAEIYRGTDTRDTLMHMAGYGDHGFAGSSTSFDGLKRAGNNVANAFGGDFGYWSIEEQFWIADFELPGRAEPLEWQGAPGDSGSPWFAELDGRMQLVGISSFTKGDLNYGSSTGAVRTSLYTDWIDEHVNPVPEPSTLAMMLGMLPFLVGFRRRFG